MVEVLRPHLDADNTLRPETLEAALVKGSPIGDAIDVLLKGPEPRLPPGVSFRDKDGHERFEIRTRWWDGAART